MTFDGGAADDGIDDGAYGIPLWTLITVEMSNTITSAVIRSE